MASRLFYAGPDLATLHAEYAKESRIDDRAPVTSTSSLVIAASPERVWAVLSDLPGWQAWHHGFELLELDEVRPDSPMRWRMGRVTIRSTFAVVTPGRELTWSGRVYGYKAVDQHLLAPVGADSTRVTIAESLSGPLASLLYRPATLRAGHERWLADLKAQVENG